MKKLKPKDKIKLACKKAIERCGKKQEELKKYWDGKIEEANANMKGKANE